MIMVPVPVPEGGRKCSRCGRVKPLDAFTQTSMCRACRRAYDRRRYAENGRRETPEAAERRRADDRRRYLVRRDRRVAYEANYLATPRGRLVRALAAAKSRLRTADGAVERAALGRTAARRRWDGAKRRLRTAEAQVERDARKLTRARDRLAASRLRRDAARKAVERYRDRIAKLDAQEREED